MRKMNNKGFAISTLLYGLAIMIFLIVFALMSILGTTRKNSKNLADTIDDELNRYGLINQNMIYDSSIDESAEGRPYYVVEDGWYKVELWSAAVMRHDTVYQRGSYNTGIIYLEKGQVLFVFLKAAVSMTPISSYITIENNDDDHIIMKGLGYDDPSTFEKDYFIYGYAGGNFTKKPNQVVELADGTKPIFYDPMIVAKGNDSASKFRITKISNNSKSNNPVTKYSNKLDNIQYIKDCTTGTNQNNSNAWQEIQAMKDGENVAFNKSVTVNPNTNFKDNKTNIVNGKLDTDDELAGNSSSTEDEYCVQVDLGQPYDLDEIAVWHYAELGWQYHKHKIYIGSDTNNLTQLRETYYYNNGYTHYDESESEDILGIRYSKYQPITYDEITNGNYYIFNINEDTKSEVLYETSNHLSTKYFTPDDKKIIWKLSKNEDDSSFRIVNLDTKNAIEKDGRNVVCTNNPFNANQKWKLARTVGAYYSIQDPTTTGPIDIITTNSTLTSGSAYSPTTRFKFIRVY